MVPGASRPRPGPLRILLVDDSPTVRHALRQIFESDPEIELCGVAMDGEQAVRMVEELRPDLVTMDVGMPGIDGLEATRQIMRTCPVPIVVISGMPGLAEAEVSFEALAAGAVDVMVKPERVSQYRDEGRRRALLRHLKNMASVEVIRRGRTPAPGSHVAPSARREFRVVGVGASTGGPPVVKRILGGLNASSPPVVVTQHMAGEFMSGFTSWLQQRLSVPVVVATDGAPLRGGHVYVTPADRHLEITSGYRLRVYRGEPINFHRPSIEPLMASIARVAGELGAGCLLTGMGRDGAEGLVAIRKVGGFTCVQDERSSTVFGMPRAAIELGAAPLVGDVSKLASVFSELRAV